MSANGPRLLLVEDGDGLRRTIERALGGLFGGIDTEARGDAAVLRLSDASAPPYDVVITDLRLPGATGLDVLRAARTRSEASVVLLMSAHGSIEAAVEAMRDGAFDFVAKPFELGELEARTRRAIEHGRLVGEVDTLQRERAEQRAGGHPLVGEDPGFRAAVELARRAARGRSTVLVTGETGTGKELIATLVHASSARRDAPLVKVNCAALPETLLESELFGHERGAFTSADRTRIGRFEQADGGTLFLDEIGDMSPTTQAKLLRVLQDGEFQRLGGTRVIQSDVRIVAATNRDLRAAIREGGFREDLFFRLNVISIPLPPLRERRDDIPRLATHLLELHAAEIGRGGLHWSPAALDRLRRHDWPGNVRELRNVVERAALLSEGPAVEVDPQRLGGDSVTEEWRPQLPAGGLGLAEIERGAVLEALEATGFVQKDAAERLRVSRRKLNYMIQRIGITHPTWRRNRGG